MTDKEQPAETLKEFISFCGRKQLHFISDEIYAKSLFANPALLSAAPFISTLALDYGELIDPSLVHILYGASKDFCANGMRLGLVCTKNKGTIGAMSSIGSVQLSPHDKSLTDTPNRKDILLVSTYAPRHLGCYARR